MGACAVIDEENVTGIRKGNHHFADSGMQFRGRRQPKTGYRNCFEVMEEVLIFTFPGLEAHVKGGAGPNTVAQCS